MAAPKGNRFWEIRSTHGRNPKYIPDTLWDAACQYFKWVEDNPLFKDQVNFYQGVPVHEPVPLMRAMTLDGLFLFLDISHVTWLNYRKKKDFITIVTRVEAVIRAQKFAGAAAEMLNPNIIARDLGLVDKQKLDTTIKDSRVRVEVLTNEKANKVASLN